MNHSVFLALGSNVGNSAEFLNKAVQILSQNIEGIEQAPRYTTKAVGYTDQDDFLNTVVHGQTSLSPQELLKFVKVTEREVGRISRFRWGPREIDIDILLYDDLVLSEENLSVPHLRLNERDFALRPLVDLAPDLVDPRTREKFAQILKNLPIENRSIGG